MMVSRLSQASQRMEGARFYVASAPSGTDQELTIDLVQERDIFEVGIDFPRYWNRKSVWDYVMIQTSTDNITWHTWYHSGVPTLRNPVRYIKYSLGYPSANTSAYGSAVFRVYAFGDESGFTSVDEKKWPKLYKETGTGKRSGTVRYFVTLLLCFTLTLHQRVTVQFSHGT